MTGYPWGPTKPIAGLPPVMDHGDSLQDTTSYYLNEQEEGKLSAREWIVIVARITTEYRYESEDQISRLGRFLSFGVLKIRLTLSS